ncbi:MAG: hypothetical protein JW791_04070 [Nanoarchaeota archaeon]|nr:hypothetical protein [Nanoarchaeota archaeon]
MGKKSNVEINKANYVKAVQQSIGSGNDFSNDDLEYLLNNFYLEGVTYSLNKDNKYYSNVINFLVGNNILNGTYEAEKPDSASTVLQYSFEDVVKALGIFEGLDDLKPVVDAWSSTPEGEKPLALQLYLAFREFCSFHKLKGTFNTDKIVNMFTSYFKKYLKSYSSFKNNIDEQVKPSKKKSDNKPSQLDVLEVALEGKKITIAEQKPSGLPTAQPSGLPQKPAFSLASAAQTAKKETDSTLGEKGVNLPSQKTVSIPKTLGDLAIATKSNTEQILQDQKTQPGSMFGQKPSIAPIPPATSIPRHAHKPVAASLPPGASIPKPASLPPGAPPQKPATPPMSFTNPQPQSGNQDLKPPVVHNQKSLRDKMLGELNRTKTNQDSDKKKQPLTQAVSEQEPNPSPTSLTSIPEAYKDLSSEVKAAMNTLRKQMGIKPLFDLKKKEEKTPTQKVQTTPPPGEFLKVLTTPPSTQDSTISPGPPPPFPEYMKNGLKDIKTIMNGGQLTPPSPSPGAPPPFQAPQNNEVSPCEEQTDKFLIETVKSDQVTLEQIINNYNVFKVNYFEKNPESKKFEILLNPAQLVKRIKELEGNINVSSGYINRDLQQQLLLYDLKNNRNLAEIASNLKTAGFPTSLRGVVKEIEGLKPQNTWITDRLLDFYKQQLDNSLNGQPLMPKTAPAQPQPQIHISFNPEAAPACPSPITAQPAGPINVPGTKPIQKPAPFHIPAISELPDYNPTPAAPDPAQELQKFNASRMSERKDIERSMGDLKHLFAGVKLEDILKQVKNGEIKEKKSLSKPLRDLVKQENISVKERMDNVYKLIETFNEYSSEKITAGTIGIMFETDPSINQLKDFDEIKSGLKELAEKMKKQKRTNDTYFAQ